MAVFQGFIEEKRDLSGSKYDLTKLARKVKPVRYMTDEELLAKPSGSMFTYDIETYPNWFHIAFREVGGEQRVVAFEDSPDFDEMNTDKMAYMLTNFCLVGFFSNGFDKYLLVAAIQGMRLQELKEMADDIINSGNEARKGNGKALRGFELERKYGLRMPEMNHIDLIEVCPLSASLKMYAARLHYPVVQDLPFDPTVDLTADERHVGRMYCGNDLGMTEWVLQNLGEQMQLRIDMSKQYGVDLRSKSDAQIAEAVICKELEKELGFYPERPRLPEDYTFKYSVPDYVQFQTPLLKDVLEKVYLAEFGLDKGGSPQLPASLDIEIPIGKTVYKLGIGGLHSMEKCKATFKGEDEEEEDIDVESFYPKIIRNQRLYPAHIGEGFLIVYGAIVDRRIAAKKAKNKVVADSLKIVINGSFGKFGSKWSAFYSPDLMIQTTISGQLSLLMLIEMFELNGIEVVSANTDGIVVRYKKTQTKLAKEIQSGWEKHCDFKLESTHYLALLSRDVNNYMAIKAKFDKETETYLDIPDGVKVKGAYGNPWDDKDMAIFRFHKNPETTICTVAAQAYITHGTPISKTVRECRDITKFVAVRQVDGGAVWLANGTKDMTGERYTTDGYNSAMVPSMRPDDGEFVGKVVRWYYGKGSLSTLNYKRSGNKVPKSDGAIPIMDYTVGFPEDIDYDWYIREAKDMLYDIGYKRRPTTLQLI